MSDLFQQLRGEGRLECRGRFTLDIEQTARKMARFQFPQPQDFLPHLVAGLFRLGATSLSVDSKLDRLTLKFPGLALPKGLLQLMAEALFEEKSTLRRLAAAVQALAALGPSRFIWLGKERSQSYDYLTGKYQNWDEPRLEEIQIEGLSPQLVDLAVAELSKRGGWTRRPLRVDQRRFEWPGELDFKLGGCPAQCEWDPGTRPRLLLVMDEIVCEFRPVDAPFAWSGVCYGEFSLDASLARIQEDDRLAAILADIPGTFVECLSQGLSAAAPEDVFSLLLKPLPGWLQPLESKLLELQLFRDQHGVYLSMHQLEQSSGPIYYAQSGDLSQLDPTILVNPSQAALKCLESFLGSRLEKADQLVLRRLQREHNQRLWREQVPEVLSLSRRHWLHQSPFQHDGIHWLVGIPDDWSQPAANLVVWVEGRRLTTGQLFRQEVCCEIACEVSPDQVNELWTGLSNEAWNELEPAWNVSVTQMLQSLTEGRQPQIELRNSIKRHLAGHRCPQESYFRNTLLFQDWKGGCYSLDQLLKLAPEVKLGVVGPQFEPEGYPKEFIPEGIFLRNTGPELRILDKVQFSGLVILDYLLEDFELARAAAFTDCEITPLPAFASATVSFCCQGLRLTPLAVEHPFAFRARLVCNDLQVEACQANQSLGLERFQVRENERSRQIVSELKVRFGQVLKNFLQPGLDPIWLEWLQAASLRGLCRDFLRYLPCWPRYPDGLASLQEISQTAVVHWCSGEGLPSAAGLAMLLHRLPPSSQPALMRAAGGKNWVCLDAEFAHGQRQMEVLARPPWKPDVRGALAERKPDLWLMPSGPGLVSWLFQGRLLEEETELAPFGFHLAVECPSLKFWKRPQRQEIRQKCYALLQEYLAVQRNPMWEHWQAWRIQEVPEEIEALLQSQEWFTTNRGQMSWKNLMLEPEIWLYPSGSRIPPCDLLIVFDRNLASELILSHPRGHAIEETAQRLRAAEVVEGQRRQQEQHSQALARFPHRQKLEFGEVALNGSASRSLLWLGQEMQLPVANVPAGIAGYVTCPCQAHSLKTGGTVAELPPTQRRQLLQAVGPLLRQRIQEGPLQPQELELFAEVCREDPELESLRWILCADGTYASLQQLRPEPGKILFYWPRNYPFHLGGPLLLPILSTPLMVEVVAQVCGCQPQPHPPPWLHRELHLPSFKGLKSALTALARNMRAHGELSLLGSMRRMLAGPPEQPDPEVGRLLLEALQRRAGQLLQGKAREILLGYLSQAQIRPGKKPLWEFQGNLVLHRDHPKLRPWLGSQEPPLDVQTCLLLSLVCAINAVNDPFTDAMEIEFLEHLAEQIVESRPR
ncbi:MAG: hypothetical protein U0931_29495 [Vulcanimicrobiota bacterium]